MGHIVQFGPGDPAKEVVDRLLAERDALRAKLADVTEERNAARALLARCHHEIDGRESHGAEGDASCISEWIADSKQFAADVEATYPTSPAPAAAALWAHILTACEAEVDALLARVRKAEAERDVLREERNVLRTCVSVSLHGDGQAKANAYAALIAFDKRARAAPEGGGA